MGAVTGNHSYGIIIDHIFFLNEKDVQVSSNIHYTIDLNKTIKNQVLRFACVCNQSLPTGLQSVTWEIIEQFSDLLMNTCNNKCLK